MIIFRQPGANIIDTVDRIRAALPSLKASIPPAIDTRSCWTGPPPSGVGARRGAHLLISIALVILVVFRFSAECARHADPQRRGSGFADRHIWRDVSVSATASTISR